MSVASFETNAGLPLVKTVGSGKCQLSVTCTYGHGHAAYADVGAKTLSDARKLPEEAHRHRVFPLIEKGWHHIVHICACADEEEDHEQEGLEVEKGGLWARDAGSASWCDAEQAHGAGHGSLP